MQFNAYNLYYTVTVIKPSTSDLLNNPNVNSQLEVYNLGYHRHKHTAEILIFRDSLFIFLEL